jgi:hypothetical protein
LRDVKSKQSCAEAETQTLTLLPVVESWSDSMNEPVLLSQLLTLVRATSSQASPAKISVFRPEVD